MVRIERRSVGTYQEMRSVMIREKELSDPSSCFNKAKDDEPMFVLLARDRDAPAVIRYWLKLRAGRKDLRLEQAFEAETCAKRMEDWLYENTPKETVEITAADVGTLESVLGAKP